MEPVVKRLIVAGFIAPIPIMWSEILHWCYYSFVFFYLFAIISHIESRSKQSRLVRCSGAVRAVSDSPAEVTGADRL